MWVYEREREMFITSYSFIITVIIVSFASLLGKWPRVIHAISNHFIVFICMLSAVVFPLGTSL